MASVAMVVIGLEEVVVRTDHGQLRECVASRCQQPYLGTLSVESGETDSLAVLKRLPVVGGRWTQEQKYFDASTVGG